MSELKRKYVKTTVSIEAETFGKIAAITNKSPYPKQTYVINSLLTEVFKLREKLKEQENLHELVQIKSLYVLRELARLRGDEFLQEVDNSFQEELPTLKQMLIKDGINYAT